MTTIKALYVDDEPDLLEIGRLFLETSGDLRIDTCTSPLAAQEKLRSLRYDAIISDYQMPEMDGIAFLKCVRSEFGTIPFILFTGRGREEVVIEAINNGADFYLQKGGAPQAQFAELAHKIRQAVQKKRAEASIHDHERRESDIINFLPDATFAIDTQGVVIAWNRAMERMTGIAAAAILGKGNSEYALPFYHERRPILIDLVLKNDPLTVAKYSFIKREGKTLFSEITVPHFKDGRGATLWFTASPLYDGSGAIVGAIESIRDVTDRKRIETALRESNEKFREMADMMPQIIYETDDKGILTYANAVAFEMFRYEREDFAGGLNVISMLSPEDRERGAQAFAGVLSGKQTPATGQEYRALRKDGSSFPVTIYTTPIRSGNRVTGARGIIIDISARKGVEVTLNERERFLTTLISNLSGFVYRSRNDRDWTMTYISEGCREMTGYVPEDFLNNRTLTYNDLIHPDHRQRIWQKWQVLLGKKEVFEDEYPIVTKTGENRWVWERGRGVYSDDGGLQFLEGLITDITTRKRAETLLRAQYDLGKVLSAVHGVVDTLEACLDTAIRVSDLDAGGIYIVDEGSGDVDLANHKGLPDSFVASASHYPAGSPQVSLIMKGDPVYTRHRDAGVPLDPGRLEEGLRAIAIIPVLHENRVIACLNIASHTLEEIPASSRRTLETFAAQIGTAIANAKVDELARRNRLNLEATFASIDDFIFVLDEEGRIITFNPVVTQRLGYSREELVGQPVLMIHSPDRSGENRKILGDMLSGKCAFCPVPLEARDGTRIPVETRVTRGTWDNRPVLIGISRDIAERERVEAALRKSEEQLSLVIAGSGAGLWDWNIPTGAVTFNDRWAEIVGYTLAELEPISIRTWTALCHPDDLKHSGELLEKHVAGEIPSYELEARMLHKDGHWVWVLDRGKVVEWDSRHRPVRMTGTHMDITRLKQMEDALRQANTKLNLLNSITRHDISNQLLALNGFLALSKENLADHDRMAEFIAKEERIAATLESQIVFTRYYQDMGVNEPVWQNVEAHVKNAAASLPLKGITISTGCSDLEVYADPLFEKVFYNLIDNALRYGGAGLTTVRISSHESAEGLVLICEDDGAGIGPADKAHLFERGFGKNTGFGLFLVREILGITGITIRETSEPGTGARFELLVPRGGYRFTRA
ncbi:MAG: PAS domain S-box protein [Methanoregula sp.]|nr:PAS domain S-box protein [Methanoregula sp.]